MALSTVVEVYLESQGVSRLVGQLRYENRGHKAFSCFVYSRSWLEWGGAFALDPANLPLSPAPFYSTSQKSVLPGAIRDTAPDRWGRLLAQRAYRKAGEDRFRSELDYLLALSEHARIGALRFKPAGDSRLDADMGHSRSIPTLIQLPALLAAADAVHHKVESSSDLGLLLHEGSPLGGARPKSAVITKDGVHAIAKFPMPDDDRSIPHGEILALCLARHAGIDAAQGRIVMAAGRPVAVIRRFDRSESRRIPFLSAMSLLGKTDGDTATYTDIAECIRMYSAAPKQDLHELWRRVVYGVMINNLDDHLRNHGFQYAGNNQWRLAPAYDLNPVPSHKSSGELATWISEEGPEASLDIAIRAAPYFGLREAQSLGIICEVAQSLNDWRHVAHSLGMNKQDVGTYSSAIRIPKN